MENTSLGGVPLLKRNRLVSEQQEGSRPTLRHEVGGYMYYSSSTGRILSLPSLLDIGDGRPHQLRLSTAQASGSTETLKG